VPNLTVQFVIAGDITTLFNPAIIKAGFAVRFMVTAALVTILSLATSAHALWSTDSRRNTLLRAGDNAFGQGAVTDGSGGAIFSFVYKAGRFSKLGVQRVDHSGKKLWRAGTLLATSGIDEIGNPHLSAWDLIPDGAGGGTILFKDAATNQLRVQRLDSNGKTLWIAPVQIGTADLGSSPFMVPGADGGTIVVWNNGGNISAARVSSSGALLQLIDVCSDAGDQVLYQVKTDNAGGAYINWYHNPDNTNRVQHLLTNGDLAWPGSGVYIAQDWIEEITPGTDSVWFTYRVGNDLLLQRILANGTFAFGSPIELANDNPEFGSATADRLGGIVLSIARQNLNGDFDLHLRRLDASGADLYTSTWVDLLYAGDQLATQIYVDESQNATVAFRDWRNSETPDIYAQRLSPDGTILWNSTGVAISTRPSRQGTPEIVPGVFGQLLMIFGDADKLQRPSIYAASVSEAGFLSSAPTAPQVGITDIITSDPRILDITGTYNFVPQLGDFLRISFTQSTSAAVAGEMEYFHGGQLFTATLTGYYKAVGTTGLQLFLTGSGPQGVRVKLSGSYSNGSFVLLGGVYQAHNHPMNLILTPQNTARGFKINRVSESYNAESPFALYPNSTTTQLQKNMLLTFKANQPATRPNMKLSVSATPTSSTTAVSVKTELTFGRLRLPLPPEQVEIVTTPLQ